MIQHEKKNVAKLSASKVISTFGNIVFDYANNQFLVSLNPASVGLVGIYQASEKIVGIFFNLFGGVVADHFQRRKVLVITDLLSGVFCLTLSLFSDNTLLLYAIITVNLLLAILDSFASPAYKSIVKEIVFEPAITKLNSILESSARIIQVGGPIIGVTIVDWVGMRGALLLDGVSFILSGIIILFIIPIVEISDNARREFSFINFFSEIKYGFLYLIKKREIFLLVVLSSLMNFFLAGYNLLLPYSQQMFSDFDGSVYGVLLTSEAIGGILGSIFSGITNKKLRSVRLILVLALESVILFLTPFIYQLFSSIGALALMIIVFAFLNSNFNIQFFSIVQTEIENGFLGRVFSIIFTCAVLFMPLGTVFFSFVLIPTWIYNFSVLGGTLFFTSIIFLCIFRKYSR